MSSKELAGPEQKPKDARAGQREAKEKKRLKLQPFKEARQRLNDIDDADTVEETMTAEERAFSRKELNIRARWVIIDRNTEGRKCPGCERIILNARSWVIVRKLRLVICRACYHAGKRGPRKEMKMKLEINIFQTENRFSLYPAALTEARQEAEMTQQDFARLAGWSRSYQWKLENGEFNTVSEATKEVIMGVLKRVNISTNDV